MSRAGWRAVTGALWLASALLLARAGVADERCIVSVVSLQGTVDVRADVHGQWSGARDAQALCPGGQVRVGEASRATLVFRPPGGERAYLRLRQGTVITLPRPGATDRFFLRLEPDVDGRPVERGALHFISRTRRELKIETPFVNAYVEGTEAAVAFEQAAGATDVTVLEGCVLVTPRDFAPGPKQDCRVLASAAVGQDLLLERFQSARATGDGTAPRRLELDPAEAIRWSLYYPPLPGPADLLGVERLLLAGEGDAALERLERLRTQGADYHALRSVILLSRGRLDAAEEAAVAAMAAPGRSRRAALARSYVHQARGDFGAARTVMADLVARFPDAAFAWARLAELRLSSGDRTGALAAAREALRLDPGSARAHTVLGFAELAVADHEEAARRFGRAIAGEPAAPLPRLGLGLARIRGGHLAAGRELLELAAILAPGDAVTRSYLGKAYVEEGRARRAREQFDIAIGVLDPADPTPWFYRALLEMGGNRPVVALRDLEASRERNDNRAVYRSRLLLDEDNAVRTTSAARVYRELGFHDRALLEGVRALAGDPASHAAHRFLADIHADRRRHEVARSSELLQAQLLQPVNADPTQPILGETNLLVLDGSGPASTTAGEYHPLFTRNRTRFYVAGVAGSQTTVGDEVTVTALHDDKVVSATQYHYKNAGFRDNQDIEHNIFNGFFQMDLAPATSIQVEARKRRSEGGDRVQRIHPFDFVPNQRRFVDTESARLGLRHAPRPGSTLLVSAARVEYEDLFTSTDFLQTVPFRVDNDAGSRETSDQLDVRYLHRLRGATLDVGAGYQYKDATFDSVTRVTFLPAPVFSPPPFALTTDNDTKHANAYGYLHGTRGDGVLWTLGMGLDDSAGGPRPLRRRFSPKLGAIWDLGHGLSARAAAFKSARRPVIGDRRLEPTQIAGFDQFFDDKFWSYSESGGAGLDYRRDPLSAGVAVTRRIVTSPSLRGSQVLEPEHTEELARLYLSTVPAEDLALSAAFVHEDLERDFVNDPGTPVRITTRTLPLELRWFAPGGVRLALSVTGVDQDVDFHASSFLPDASTHFWVTDLALEKDLPGRSGFLSATVLNLFDREIHFQDTDFDLAEAREPVYAEELSVFFGVNLAFP